MNIVGPNSLVNFMRNNVGPDSVNGPNRNAPTPPQQRAVPTANDLSSTLVNRTDMGRIDVSSANGANGLATPNAANGMSVDLSNLLINGMKINSIGAELRNVSNGNGPGTANAANRTSIDLSNLLVNLIKNNAIGPNSGGANYTEVYELVGKMS